MTTKHAEVIRNWMDHEGGCSHYNTDIPDPCDCGYAQALASLDALTREAEEAKALWHESNASYYAVLAERDAQSERIAEMEGTLLWIINCTDSEMGDGDGARDMAHAALATKEAP